MDDVLVLNLAPINASDDRPNSRRVSQLTGGRWTDRVKAKRVAKRKDERNAPDDTPESRPAKRQRAEAAPLPSQAAVAPPSARATHKKSLQPAQVISSLFSYNPEVPTPAPAAPRPVAGPSNAPLDTSSFTALGLDPLLVTHLRNKLSINAPTSIQRASLSAITASGNTDARDLFIQSQTGSGKTLAYLLPILQDLLPLSTHSYIDRSIGTLAIIIAPTRELAKQISDVLEVLLTLRLRPEGINAIGEPEPGTDSTLVNSARFTRWLVSGVLTGGATRTHEKARLRKGLPILVATPGRLLDHLQNTESFNVGKCRWLVLDEADRLMELGFADTITGILQNLDGRRRMAKQAALEGILANDVGGWDWEVRRRTVLCSATIKDDVEKLAGTALQNPIVIKGSDVPSNPDDAVQVPGSPSVVPITLKQGAPKEPPAPVQKFTPPSQLSQKYVNVPLKLRLVSLVALLRSIVAQAPPTGRLGRAAGTRIIVFFSCTDSVDFHWNMLGDVSMDGESAGKAVPKGESDEYKDDSGSESASGSEVPSKTPKKAATMKTPKTSTNGAKIGLTSDLLPGTSIYRLHGSLPLATRLASLKGFTAPPAPASSSLFTPNVKSKASQPPSDGAPSSAILFCTSVASRGLDLPLVRAVVQYDLPTENGADEYVHRVGRTARAGKGGEAWAFVAPSEAAWVPWIEGNMGTATSITGEAKEKIGEAVKIDPVGVQGVLKDGFGGLDYEDRATQVQLAFEQWVLSSQQHADQARKAFQSHMRAYATHPSSEKHIFHVRNLHTGHLAKAFALRETPSRMGGNTGASPKGKIQSRAMDSGRSYSKNSSGLGRGTTVSNGTRPGRIGNGAERKTGVIAARAMDREQALQRVLESGGAKRSKQLPAAASVDTSTAEDRMREAVRKQGRLTKQGGKAISSGASEFQVAGGATLEHMVNGARL